MKGAGRSIAFAAVAVLFWGLAVAHPWLFLRAREATLREQPGANTTPRIFSLLSGANVLRERLRTSEVIGYASEGAIDLRVGGPLQGRYYLAQYALAPTLLDLEVDPGPQPVPSDGEDAHSLVLACFRQPRQLEAFLLRNDRESVLSVAPNVALTRRRRD